MSAEIVVDAASLLAAAGRIRSAPESLVERTCVSVCNVGHDGLAEAMSGFDQRWLRGLTLEASDVEGFASRVVASVESYAQTEDSAIKIIKALHGELEKIAFNLQFGYAR